MDRPHWGFVLHGNKCASFLLAIVFIHRSLPSYWQLTIYIENQAGHVHVVSLFFPDFGFGKYACTRILVLNTFIGRKKFFSIPHEGLCILDVATCMLVKVTSIHHNLCRIEVVRIAVVERDVTFDGVVHSGKFYNFNDYSTIEQANQYIILNGLSVFLSRNYLIAWLKDYI